MRYKSIICMVLLSLLLVCSAGCLEQSSGGSASSASYSVPRENLPDGFKLLAALPENDPRVNMTLYIKDFYGTGNTTEDIGPANVTVGIYKWKSDDQTYDSRDAKITHIVLSDEDHALAAISNFKSQYDSLLKRGLPIFGNATINGHQTLEIKDINGDGEIRFLYLWNVGNIVLLVEGNQDRSQSMELASATGL
ncbi:MAG TPA: hypothetical protein PKK11_02825 [Methanothrix sp.]|mgnify:CR=1 FL=1|nr:hypothetical protein [Methanothrix sp.]HPT18648.1 hypothetical protein [Methanothrix sp.]